MTFWVFSYSLSLWVCYSIKYLVELIGEVIWGWCFLCGNVLSYEFKIKLFNFFTFYMPIQIFYFFLSQFGNLCLSKNLFVSSKLSNLLAYSHLLVLISIWLVVISDFFFVCLARRFRCLLSCSVICLHPGPSSRKRDCEVMGRSLSWCQRGRFPS